jgi:hypothetical protein
MAEASRLLERMRRSKTGWTAGDLHRLYAGFRPYTGFGFEFREGHRHRLYVHPRYPDLRATVRRASGALPAGYVSTAVHLIDTLEAREEQHGERPDA